MLSSKPFLFGTIVDVPVWVDPVATAYSAILAVPCAIRDPLAALILFVVLQVSILAHEVGHALAAKSAGLHVREIRHFGFGGLCIFEDPGRCVKTRCLVAAAGPFVNFLIASALLSLALSLPANRYSTSIVGAMVTMNAALCLGNLLPFFPLDGGQILVALLTMRWPERSAVLVTAGIGTLLAGPAWLVMIAVSVVGFPCAAPVFWKLNWSIFKRAWRDDRGPPPNDLWPPNRPISPVGSPAGSPADEADRLMASILAEQSRRNARRRSDRDAELTKQRR